MRLFQLILTTPSAEKLRSFPLHEVIAALENDEARVPGTQGHERACHWESCTNQPWEPITSYSDSQELRPVECPKCTQTLHARWIEEDDTGWAQDRFAERCPSCALLITKEVSLSAARFFFFALIHHHTKVLGVAKFSDELAQVVEQPRKFTLA